MGFTFQYLTLDQGSSQLDIFFRQPIPIVAKTLFQELERLN